MVDRWRAQTRTNLAGHPVVLVEVQFSRTIMCSADTFQDIEGQMREAGLKRTVEFVRFAMEAPREQRIFCNVPWSDAEQKRFELQPFGQIVHMLEGRPSLRIEGDPQQGYRLILATSDRELVTPLDETNIPTVVGSLQQLSADAQTQGDTALETLCDDIQDMIEPLNTLCKDLKAIRDHQQRTEQERERMERTDRELREIMREPKESVRGDQIDKIERTMRTA